MSDYERQLIAEITHLSFDDLNAKTGNEEISDKLVYYLIFALINLNDVKSIRIANSIISQKIMEPDFPEEILYYYYQNPNLYSSFNSQVRSKIANVGSKANHIKLFNLSNKKIYLHRMKEVLLKYLSFAEKKDEIDLSECIKSIKFEQNPSKSRSDLSILQNKKIGSRVIITVDEKLLPKELSDKRAINFGYYPQKKVSKIESLVLDILFKNNLLEVIRETECFTFSNGIFGKKSYQVYYANNKRFIRFNNTWIEVKPIKWIRGLLIEGDKKIDYFYTAEDLIGGIPNDEMKEIFDKEVFKIYRNMKTFEQKKETIDTKSEQQSLADLNKLIAQKNKEQEIRDEIKASFVEELKLLVEEEKADEKLLELGTIKEITRKRMSIDGYYLFKEVNGHLEFDDVFKPYLGFIDLYYVPQENLKISGIDFRDTNIKIDPQRVYGKDLSGCSFGEGNFTNVNIDFDGCNLCGTDLSELETSFDFEKSIEHAKIDENTKLPKKLIDLLPKITSLK